MTKLGGGFKDFVFSPLLPGEMIQFDEHNFSDGLKPPTRKKHCMKLTPPEWELQKHPAPASSEALCRARMKQSHKLQSRVVSDYMPIFWRSLFRIRIIQSLCDTYVAIIGSMIFRIMLYSPAAKWYLFTMAVGYHLLGHGLGLPSLSPQNRMEDAWCRGHSRSYKFYPPYSSKYSWYPPSICTTLRPFGRGPATRSFGDLLSMVINHLRVFGMIF